MLADFSLSRRDKDPALMLIQKIAFAGWFLAKHIFYYMHLIVFKLKVILSLMHSLLVKISFK